MSRILRLPSSKGGAPFSENSLKVIRLLKHGCKNRPFYHVSVMEAKYDVTHQVIEQLGSYDGVPNSQNQKLVVLNFDRIEYWIKKGAILSLPVKKLLGLAGYMPIHPKSYEEAWIRRKLLMDTISQLKLDLERKNSKNTEEQESE